MSTLMLLQDVKPAWRHFAVCVLLNRSDGVSVSRVLPSLWAHYDNPEALAAANLSRLSGMIRPLGLHRVKTETLRRLGAYFVRNKSHVDPEKPPPGCGDYAMASYRLLFHKDLYCRSLDHALVDHLCDVAPRRLSSCVFVEGPNGCGKSTLVHSLAKMGLPCVHTGGPKKSRAELLHHCRRILEMEERTSCVIDRMPMISEIVYDRALDRPPKEQHFKLIRLIGELSRPRPLVVYCRRQDTSVSLHDGVTHPKTHRKQIQKNRTHILAEYDRLLSRLSSEGIIRLVIYDYAHSTPKSLLNIMKFGGVLCAD